MIFLYEQADGRSREERLREAGEFYLSRVGRPVPRAEDCWQVEREERGKPFFPNQPELQFSISHSGSVWACVMAERPVGLDIQEHTRFRHETEQEAADRYGRMAVRFFHEREAVYVQEDPGTRFFRIWAAKESYVKYTGRGIEGDFSKVSVIPDDTAGQNTAKEIEPERKRRNAEQGKTDGCTERKQVRRNGSMERTWAVKVPGTENGKLLYFREWDYPAGMSLCVCMEQPEEQEIWLRTDRGMVLKEADKKELSV